MRRVGIANAGDRFPWYGRGATPSNQKSTALLLQSGYDELIRCTPAHRRLDGVGRTSQSVSRSRLHVPFGGESHMRCLFRDQDVENEWLRAPHSSLHGKSPLALLSNGSAEDLLIVKEYVDTTAGR